MENLSNDIHVSNRGVHALGLEVDRVWSRSGLVKCYFRGLGDINPYKFGDLPGSWAATFQDCLRWVFDFNNSLSLPDSMSIDSQNFLVFGGQYGQLFFGQRVSVFVDGIYNEYEPWTGASYPASIVFPSSILPDIGTLVASARMMGTKTKFKTVTSPELSISFAIVSGKITFDVSPTLQEFRLRNDGMIEPLARAESRSIDFGHISVSEALTIEAALGGLGRLGSDELEQAIAYGKSDEIVSRRREVKAMCNGIVLFCNDVISFLMPPTFLLQVEQGQRMLPPVAVPTDRLVSLLQEVCSSSSHGVE